MRSIERESSERFLAAKMEHRWGRRQPTDIPVCVIGKPFTATGAGRVLNVSLTGAYLETTVPLRLHALLYLQPDASASAAAGDRRIAASVVRRDASGVGLEWCGSAFPTPSVEARIGILRGIDVGNRSQPVAARAREQYAQGTERP